MKSVIEPEIKKQIDRLLADKVPFAAIRKPGEDVKLILSDSEDKFHITPWLGNTVSIDKPGNGLSEPALPSETPDSIHLENIDKVITDLKKRGTAKTVLSRIFTVDTSIKSWSETAEQLWNFYPDAFGFMFYTSQTGAWLGATPEILLWAGNDGSFTIHALAGTMEKDAAWDEKNRIEHEIVADYIASILDSIGLDYKKESIAELTYSQIKHLLTVFHGTGLEKNLRQQLLNALSPTPALAGYPKKEALDDIAHLEKHSRGCYGGYFTYENRHGSYSMVTIRCAQFDPSAGRASVYAGGGITPDSVSQEELNETYRKAAGLLNVLRKSNK